MVLYIDIILKYIKILILMTVFLIINYKKYSKNYGNVITYMI